MLFHPFVLYKISVIGVLIGLSLAESEIEYIHDHSDVNLSRMLIANKLMGGSSLEKSQTTDESVGDIINQMTTTHATRTIITNGNMMGDGGEFALLLTPPLLSFSF